MAVGSSNGQSRQHSSEFMFELEASSNSGLPGLRVLADAACCSTLLADIVRTHVPGPGLVLLPGFCPHDRLGRAV